MGINIILIGARTKNRGLGPFFAKHLTYLGANVSAIVGTSKQSLRQAEKSLLLKYGISTSGYLTVEDACKKKIMMPQ